MMRSKWFDLVMIQKQVNLAVCVRPLVFLLYEGPLTKFFLIMDSTKRSLKFFICITKGKFQTLSQGWSPNYD